MPFIANTPESLVARSDSKNPATTCRGITSGGRPCRRSISAADIGQKSLGSGGRPSERRLRVDDPRDERLYCWQHKEQASMSARSSPGPRAFATPILEERTSLDTLADRLNLLSVKSARGESRRSARPSSGSTGWARSPNRKPEPKLKPKPSSGSAICFCCFRMPMEEPPSPPARPKPRPIQPSHPSSTPGSEYSASRKNEKLAAMQQVHSQASSGSSYGKRQSLPGHLKSSRPPSMASQTAKYLSLIPPTLSPQTASALMAELAKPFSQVDEPGYIYMFWLTPESQQATPPTEAARSLLSPPSRPAGSRQRRASDVVASFAGKNHSTNGSKNGINNNSTLLLKIGRANNVQRRLNEWKRQCGYNLSLIRYYPYISSNASNSEAAAGTMIPRKMPHSHKVERLIHIELAGFGLKVTDKDKCGACGREHREWFEVEATRKSVATVDEVIRRWADWDEGRFRTS